MTSLRKEINTILHNYAHFRDTGERRFLTFQFDEHCADEILKLIENKIYELMGREDLKEPEDEIDFILLEARFRALEEVLELLKK